MASAELQALQKRVGVSQPQRPQQPKKQGPGGLEGFLVNNLPAITSGIGAVGGSFLAPGAGTIGGGAAGGALGEALKRKLLGQKEDFGQIAIQGLEGGALSGIGAGARGIKSGAQALTKLGTGATKEATPAAEKTGESFLNRLTRQGRQKQANTAGISFGSTAKGAAIESPQQTEQMLATLKNHGITTGNANTTGASLETKLDEYGKQISDHFKSNNAPLHPEDTKIIASNFLEGLKTTDPAILKQAQIVADDLEKNVKSTKDLWDFRRTLDSRIPDTKFGDEATTAKIAALKNARQYISKELGDVPGVKDYHDLASIKPFVVKEGNRLNNPSGGIVGRVLASGPVQKGEDLFGKGMERVGQAGAREESASLKVAGANPPPVDPALLRAAAQTGAIPEDVLQSASQATRELPQAIPQSQNFWQKLVGAGANPIANPGKTTGAVVKQSAGRGFGIPAAVSQSQQASARPTDEPNFGQTLLDTSAATPEDTNNPYSSDNVMANVQAILSQGGKQKDVAEYLSNVAAYQKLTQASGSTTGSTKPSAQQFGLAQSGYQSLQKLAKLLESDPSIVNKNATPGQGTPLIGSLVSNAAGASNYHALADNILSSLIHLQTGATATKEEMTAAHGQLPQPGDSAEERQNKITTLLSNFQPFLSYGQDDQSDLQSLLAQ